MRSRHQFLEAFQPDEADVAVEWELDFILMEDVEQHHFVPTEAQVPQPCQRRFGVVEGVGDQEHKPATRDAVRDFV